MIYANQRLFSTFLRVVVKWVSLIFLFCPQVLAVDFSCTVSRMSRADALKQLSRSFRTDLKRNVAPDGDAWWNFGIESKAGRLQILAEDYGVCGIGSNWMQAQTIQTPHHINNRMDNLRFGHESEHGVLLLLTYAEEAFVCARIH